MDSNIFKDINRLAPNLTSLKVESSRNLLQHIIGGLRFSCVSYVRVCHSHQKEMREKERTIYYNI